jgi:hypothetical protein
MLIPYTWLSERPQAVILCEGVPVYFSLSGPGSRNCLISLSRFHCFQGGRCISVPVGTSLELEYKGIVCEVHLGRWLQMCDA